MLLALFCAQFVILSVVLGGGRAAESVGSAGAAVATFQSVCLWLALGWLARAGRGPRVIVALVAGAALALQGLFYRRFGQWIDGQVIRSAIEAWRDLAPAARAEMPRVVAVALGCAAVEVAFLHAARPRRKRPRLWPAAVPALLFAVLLPVSSPGKGPPDLRLAGAFGALVRPARAGAIAAVELPELPPRAARSPNVVLIVTESVRADEYCSAPAAMCPTAPEVNALLPERIGFSEMRSLASYTSVSMAVLATGRTQEVRKEELFSSPTVFDAIKAIRAGGGATPYTAYWSSHYWPIFHWEDPKRGVDSYVTRETLFAPEEDGEDGDARLAEYAVKRLAELPSPYFVVLHFHDTHLLYSFDEKGAPFQPWTREVRWEKLGELRNAYRNAIFEQDRSIAKVVSALVEGPRWESTVVLFTSDHGEAFGEHHQIHHGQDLLDEQIHVPGFIAFGSKAVTPEAAAALRANAGAFLTHLDVAPTILDLFGVLDSYGLAVHVGRMPGRSLLRPIEAPPPAVAMTNCSEAFPCPWNTWGVMRGDRKLEAQAWDFGWNCHRLGGEEAALPLEDEGCAALVKEARSRFERLPNGEPY